MAGDYQTEASVQVRPRSVAPCDVLRLQAPLPVALRVDRLNETLGCHAAIDYTEGDPHERFAEAASDRILIGRRSGGRYRPTTVPPKEPLTTESLN